VGFRADEEVFSLRLLDGRSDGALGELVVWKLLRVEVGLLGAAVGLGPFDVALGTFFYEPRVPRMQKAAAADEAPSESCPVCEARRAAP